MKPLFKTLILSQIFIFLSAPVFAGSPIAIGIQAGQAELKSFITDAETTLGAVSILQDHTGKFENDNMFVQLYNSAFNIEKLKLVNRDVYIVLPSRLSFDSLMETLIKIRAARTLGAKQLYVSSESLLKDVVIEGDLGNELNLEEFITAAGADSVFENHHFREMPRKLPRKLEEIKPLKNSVTQADYWVGGSNHPELLNQVAAILGKKAYSFEELRTNSDLLKGRKIYWIAAPITPVNENFFNTLAQIRWLEHHGASVHLITPYLPYARSDKPEFNMGVTTQGRLVADLIEAVGTQGITVVRAHAPQSLGFFKIYSKEISGRSTIVDYLKSQEVECVISPDAGFQKDATQYQFELRQSYGGQKSVRLTVMNKERNSDGKETLHGGTGLENIEGKKVVIIDDETSSGGTLHQVAQFIQNYHPKSVFAVVTHLAGPAQKSIHSHSIQKIIVTNTLPIGVSHSKLSVLSIAPELAEDIQLSESNR